MLGVVGLGWCFSSLAVGGLCRVVGGIKVGFVGRGLSGGLVSCWIVGGI